MPLGPLVTSLVILIATTRVVSDLSYLVINQPSQDAQWQNNNSYYVSWTQGLGQGIHKFDVELTRLEANSLFYVAQNVPSMASRLPIYITDIPPADDYYLLFMNFQDGKVYSVSQRFSILPALPSALNSSSAAQPSSNNGEQLLATVSVSGPPNPTSTFSYTFPASSGASEGCSFGTRMALAAVLATLWMAS